jgi:hypothetical protein
LPHEWIEIVVNYSLQLRLDSHLTHCRRNSESAPYWRGMWVRVDSVAERGTISVQFGIRHWQKQRNVLADQATFAVSIRLLTTNPHLPPITMSECGHKTNWMHLQEVAAGGASVAELGFRDSFGLHPVTGGRSY